MILTEFKEILATAASICTILQFLAGVLVCRKYMANGTTGEDSGLAFITCFMSCSLWLRYGLLIGDGSVVLVNVFGTTLQLCYIIVFILYSIKKTLILKQLVVAICFVTMVYVYSIHEEDKAVARRRVGLLSCGLTIAFFASPLTMLAHVIRVKSAESLPFPVIVASLIVSCQWLLYGLILGDPFIQMPNLLGCILCTFQLSLFMFYPGKRSDVVHLI